MKREARLGMVEGEFGGDNIMKILESFPHLINPAVSSHNVLYFMSFRVYQETLLFMMDALSPSILKLYTFAIFASKYSPSTSSFRTHK